MTTFEICEHIGELTLSCFGIEPKNPVDNMIGPGLICWIEIAGFSRRFERSDDDPRRIGA